MGKYHSTVSRRDFMKILGLGGVGLGAAATAPIFHDLDEVLASSQAELKRPFWVKEVPKPTVEIDWDSIPRWDASEQMWSKGLLKAVGQEKYDFIFKLKAANEEKWLKANRPGYNLRDVALASAGHR